MSISLEDQLRQLGGALDELADEVTLAEVVESAGVSPTSMQPERRRWLLPAAAAAIVLVGVALAVAIGWGRNDLQPAGQPDVPPELFPAGAEFVAARQTSIGRFDVYEAPSPWIDGDRQRCIYLTTNRSADEFTTGKCFALDDLENRITADALTIGDEFVVFGIAPPSWNGEIRVESRLGGTWSAKPDDAGIWSMAVDSHEGRIDSGGQGLEWYGLIDPVPQDERELDLASRPLPVQILPHNVAGEGTTIELDIVGLPEFDPGLACSARYVPIVHERADRIDLVIGNERPQVFFEAIGGCVYPFADRTIAFELSAPVAGREVRVHGRPLDSFVHDRPLVNLGPDRSEASERFGIPETWEVRSGHYTSAGRFVVYEVPTSGEVCVAWWVRDAQSLGCYPADDIDAGRVWGRVSGPNGVGLWGLAPRGTAKHDWVDGAYVEPGDDFVVTVDDERVVSSLGDFWFAPIDDDVAEFSIEVPCCDHVFAVDSPPPASEPVTD